MAPRTRSSAAPKGTGLPAAPKGPGLSTPPHGPGAGSGTATAVRIRALLPSLQPSMRHVAEQVLADTRATASLTVTELAVASGVSEATVIRFCKAIGLAGYPQLRLALAAENGRAQGADRGDRDLESDIGPGDNLAKVVEKIAFADARAVEETGAQLDIVMLERVVEALVRAQRVDLYGVGASAFVALDFQHKLHRVGRVAFAWS